MTHPTNLPTGGGSYQPEQHEVRGAAKPDRTRTTMTPELSLLDAITSALKNGHEGSFSHNWDENDADAGFWIPNEDYERLLAAIATVARPTPPSPEGTGR